MAKYNAYSQEIIAFAREYGPEHSIEETAAAITERFGRPMTYGQTKSMFHNHHIHASPRKGRPGKTKYPDGMGDYIREIATGRTKYEIAELVNAKYGPGTITPTGAHTYKKNHKIKTGLTGQYQKGNVPYNKGKHPPTVGRMAETQFKPGNKPHTWRPVGSERINVDGYIEVKVKDPKTWKAKHRLIWEEHNGPVPKNHVVVFKDGNKLNTDISNLALVSKSVHARMNQLGIQNPGAEIFDTAVAVAKLASEAGRLKRKKKEGKGK